MRSPNVPRSERAGDAGGEDPRRQGHPDSGKPEELLHAAGIDADGIIAAVREMTGGRS